MITNIFVAFNSFLECTGSPKFDDHSPEVFAAGFKRHLLTSEDDKVFQFENVTWYHLGTFDDESMKIEVLKEPVKLLSCNEVLDKRKIKAKLLEAARKAEKENVGEVKD